MTNHCFGGRCGLRYRRNPSLTINRWEVDSMDHTQMASLTTPPPVSPEDMSGVMVAEVLEPPTEIGKYHVTSLLGQGAQANVYRAVHPALGRDVIIKLSRHVAPSAGTSQTPLAAEARGACRRSITTTDIAQVYDPRTPMRAALPLVMEYFQGRDRETVRWRDCSPAPSRRGACCPGCIGIGGCTPCRRDPS